MPLSQFSANLDYTSIDINLLVINGPPCQFASVYFTTKKCDVPKGKLEKVVPASMPESVKAKLQHSGRKVYNRSGLGSQS